MSAVEALRAARAVGVSVRIDGNDIVLEAATPPPPTVIDLLSRHKAAIIQELRKGANDTTIGVNATRNSQEIFEFAYPDELCNDYEQERAAIIAAEWGMDLAAARMEARWQADRERCWLMFLRNAQRILEAPESHRVKLLARYQTEAIRRYGEHTGIDMAASLRNWIDARGLH